MKFKCRVLCPTSPSITAGDVYLSDYIDSNGVALIIDDEGYHSVLWPHEYRIIRERSKIPLVDEENLIGDDKIIYHNKV